MAVVVRSNHVTGRQLILRTEQLTHSNRTEPADTLYQSSSRVVLWLCDYVNDIHVCPVRSSDLMARLLEVRGSVPGYPLTRLVSESGQGQ